MQIDKARADVAGVIGRGVREPPKDLPFSREAKKIFETALMESRRMSMSFITPEHIMLAVLSVGDATSRRVLEG